MSDEYADYLTGQLDECRHQGDLQYARIKELEAENTRLTAELKTSVENTIGMTRFYFQEKDKVSKEQDRSGELEMKVIDCTEENERLRAELATCRQAAFENGRDVGERVGAELGY